MKIISKRVFSDENGRPSVVQMDYDEFMRFEEIVESLEPRNAYERMLSAFGTVKWDEDPVAYQRRLRDEWD